MILPGRGTQHGTSNPGCFFEYIGNNFLPKEIKDLTRELALLDYILTNKEELVRDMKVGGSLATVTMRWYSSEP